MEEFNKNIVKWVQLDNKIKENNNIIKNIRSERDQLETNIIEYANLNNLSDNIFNISSMNTQLQVHNTSTKESISYKFLENTFLKYFQENNDNCQKTKSLMDFIKNNRNSVDKCCLKRG